MSNEKVRESIARRLSALAADRLRVPITPEQARYGASEILAVIDAAGYTVTPKPGCQ